MIGCSVLLFLYEEEDDETCLLRGGPGHPTRMSKITGQVRVRAGSRRTLHLKTECCSVWRGAVRAARVRSVRRGVSQWPVSGAAAACLTDTG